MARHGSPGHASAAVVVATMLAACLGGSGCRSGRLARLAPPDGMNPFAAPATVGKQPSVADAVAGLLARHVGPAVIQASADEAAVQPPSSRRIAVAAPRIRRTRAADAKTTAVQDRVATEITDRIGESQAFEAVDGATLAAGLEAAGLQADDLASPQGRKKLAKAFEESGADVDFLLVPEIEGRQVMLALTDLRSGATESQAADLETAPARFLPWGAE
jgi:hypothetical protein